MYSKEWAKKMGMSRETVERWCRWGKMPCPVEKINGRWHIYDPKFDNTEASKIANQYTILYARVSSNDQKEDLERQADSLQAFAVQAKIKNYKLIKEGELVRRAS